MSKSETVTSSVKLILKKLTNYTDVAQVLALVPEPEPVLEQVAMHVKTTMEVVHLGLDNTATTTITRTGCQRIARKAVTNVVVLVLVLELEPVVETVLIVTTVVHHGLKVESVKKILDGC